MSVVTAGPGWWLDQGSGCGWGFVDLFLKQVQQNLLTGEGSCLSFGLCSWKEGDAINWNGEITCRRNFQEGILGVRFWPC